MSCQCLVLTAQCDQTLSYYDDWLDAFINHSALNVSIVNIQVETETKVCNLIETARHVILHHSVTADTNVFLSRLKHPLQSRKGKLWMFVGNEVNLAIFSMSERLLLIQQICPDFILTQLLQEAGEWLYEASSARVVSIPHALNPSVFKSKQTLCQRPYDVGVVSARYPVYVGDDERNRLLGYFRQRLSDSSHITSSEDGSCRLSRSEWAAFLTTHRATIATEAGSHYLSRNDELLTSVRQYIIDSLDKKVVSSYPSLALSIINSLPSAFKQWLKLYLGKYVTSEQAVDEYDDDKRQAIFTKFYHGSPQCPVYSKALSSRHFDAIGTKTVLIMHPGRYNDILKPGVHYLELARDFHNYDLVMDQLQMIPTMQSMVDEAYDDIVSNHTHQHRVSLLYSMGLGQ